MKTRILIALLVAVVQVSAIAGDFAFTDPNGKQITVKIPAKRIVSLSPAVTEILYASGAGGMVVGVTQFCNYPADAASKPQIAGFGPKSINMEAIIALAPDVVIGEAGTHASVASSFANAGLKLLLLKIADFGDVTNAMTLAGKLAGTEGVADAAVISFNGRVEKVQSVIKTAGAKQPLVFWEVWDEPLMSAGSGTFIDILISKAGGKNCFSDVKEAYPMVSFEQIVARNPEVIMSPFTHGDKVTLENLSKRPGWAGLKAVKEKKIFLLDDDIVSRPGPRLADALELIAEKLHPSLFPRR